MTKETRLEVSEQTAKVFRVWEELGGPKYLTLDNARELCQEMTPTEFGEVPSWPRRDDEKVGVSYTLPARFQRHRQFGGFSS